MICDLNLYILHSDSWNKSFQPIVKELLNIGTEIGPKSGTIGQTPLYQASLVDHREIVSLLVDYGAGIDMKNPDGYGSLQIATEHGHRDVMSVLAAKMKHLK